MSARRSRDNALALMVVLAIAMAFMPLDPLGVAKPLEDTQRSWWRRWFGG